MVRAVLFDLDDTLFPEMEFVRSGFRAAARRAAALYDGCEENDTYIEFLGIFKDGIRGKIFDEWLARHGFPMNKVGDLVSAYRTHFPRIAPYPEVLEVLTQLSSRYKLGVLSDGYLDVQERKWKALSLDRYFDVVVFTDGLGREYWKPSPQGFREAARRLEVSESEMVYISDNPEKDFLGARRAGMKGIRIRRPEGIYRHLEPAGLEFAPDCEILDMKELISALESI